MNGSLGRSAAGVIGGIDGFDNTLLRSPKNVVIVPHFGHDGLAVVERPFARSGLVVPGSAAADVRKSAKLALQRLLEVFQRVRSFVGRLDTTVCEPIVGRQTDEVLDGRLEEVHDLLVLPVLRAVAFGVEGGIAGSVLRELVAPEPGVVLVLSNPVLVHPSEEIVLSERLEESTDIWARVRWDGGAVGFAVGRVGGRDGVILAGEIAVLGVGAVAEVGPETVERPGLGRQQLAFGFEAGVGVPELSG